MLRKSDPTQQADEISTTQTSVRISIARRGFMPSSREFPKTLPSADEAALGQQSDGCGP